MNKQIELQKIIDFLGSDVIQVFGNPEEKQRGKNKGVRSSFLTNSMVKDYKIRITL